MDFQDPYLRALFNSHGINQIQFVHAEEQYHEGCVAQLALEWAECAIAELEC